MTYMDLQALRHYVYQTQNIIYETRSCIQMRIYPMRYVMTFLTHGVTYTIR
jgi:hypothetical protein